MFRLIRNIVIIAILVLLVGGVIEIQIHPERVGDLPRALSEPFTDAEKRASWAAWFIQVRRDLENRFVKDQSRQLELATLAVETDATELEDLLSGEHDQTLVLQRAELMAAALEKLNEVSEDVSIDTLLDQHQQVKGAITLATEVNRRLEEGEEERDALLGRLKEALALVQGQLSSVEIKDLGTDHE